MALQSKVHSQMYLVAVPRRALLPAIGHDLLAGSVVLDETVAVLAVEVFFHRGFGALDAVVIEIGKPDYVAKHRAVGVDACGVVLEVNSTHIAGTEFFTQRICLRRGYLAFDHDIPATAV